MGNDTRGICSTSLADPIRDVDHSCDVAYFLTTVQLCSSNLNRLDTNLIGRVARSHPVRSAEQIGLAMLVSAISPRGLTQIEAWDAMPDGQIAADSNRRG